MIHPVLHHDLALTGKLGTITSFIRLIAGRVGKLAIKRDSCFF